MTQQPERVAALISEGLSPYQIARRLKISTESVVQYVYRAIGEGRMRQSDVLFALSKEFRENVELLLKAKPDAPHWAIAKTLKETLQIETDVAEVRLYLDYKEKRVYLGDMYEYLSELELTLHRKVKSCLEKQFGPDETEWWRQGVPEAVRRACAEARERDTEFVGDPAYSYTTLIQLAEIVDKQWGLVGQRLPAEASRDKPTLLKQLKRLNGLRNRVMHPVRSEPPTEDDFEFVREMHRLFRESKWR